MTQKKSTISKVIRTFVVLCLVLILALLFSFVFRNSLVKWVSSFWLTEDVSIECLDFDVGMDPLLVIKTLCLKAEGIEIQINNAEYTIASSEFSKRNFITQANVNIERIDVLHQQIPYSSDADPEASPVAFEQTVANNELWSLPELLPLIKIAQINIDSYLFEHVLSISIFQPSRSELAIRGDIEANLVIAKGNVSGDFNWSGKLILSQSQQLEIMSQPYQGYIKDWQGLMEMPIQSHFQYSGSMLQSQHEFNLSNVITFDNCAIPLQVDGVIDTQLILTSLQLQIDLSSLHTQVTTSQCSSATAVTTAVNLDSWLIDIPALNTVSQSGITLPEINLMSNAVENPVKIKLNDIQISSQNDVKLNYQMTLNSNATAILSADSAQSIDAKLNITASGSILKEAEETRISGTENLFQISDVTTDLGTIKSVNTRFDFALLKSADGPWKTSGNGQIQANELTNKALTIRSLVTDFNIEQDTIALLTVNLKTKLQGIQNDKFAVKTVSNDLSLSFAEFQQISGNGKSKLQGITANTVNISSIDFNHQVNGQIQPYKLAGNHEFTLPSGLLGNLFHDEQNISVLVPEQSVTYLNSIVKQLAPELNLLTGKLAVSLTKANDESDFNGKAMLNNLSAEYQDYQIINAQIDAPFLLDSSGIQLNNGKINIEEINVGVPMTQIDASLSMHDSVPKLDFAQAHIIGGQVTLSDFWLDNRKQLLMLDINDIDLKQLVDLQNQEGIEVSGEVSGDLPIYWDSGFSTIDKGILLNDGPGKLKISNNEAFNAIKQQQDQLAFLENVEFSKLSSEVSLSDDGWLDLKIGINGINPEKNQEINFNYSHKENIFTLFKSMRITNSVQNSIEKRIQQRLSNKDKNL
ncbi:YdbH domain-containing protein [Aliiglaciecola sp. 2_MG-2023]|uniref:YdbH domain-containing protein n=1 Tax=unclassified Aliiglaciecola TaxID=2593648 RepID=UPI0026E23AB2|nr:MULTISPECIES: YdbH domain-containing protein [unclassified Aliiglaciecola]MDO6710544.1 YdbH domain-containing protein [Aliiglaciecola sp. 2_MG-2023]MDO6751591.1 YdbH domain-containing protein [Aliiglaciecola sp. 1_MG-2023]